MNRYSRSSAAAVRKFKQMSNSSESSFSAVSLPIRRLSAASAVSSGTTNPDVDMPVDNAADAPADNGPLILDMDNIPEPDDIDSGDVW